MNLSKRQRRTAKKLVLPLIALAMMTTAMMMEAHDRAQQTSFTPAPASAARLPHDLRTR